MMNAKKRIEIGTLVMAMILLFYGIYFIKVNAQDKSIRREETYSLIYSYQNELYAMNLDREGNVHTKYLIDWNKYYSYEIDTKQLSNIYGGLFVYKVNDSKKFNGYFMYLKLQNPYKSKINDISLYINEELNKYQLVTVSDAGKANIIYGSDLKITNYLRPIGWRDDSKVILGEFYLEHPSIINFFILDTNNNSIKKLDINVNYPDNAILGPNETMMLFYEDYTEIVDLNSGNVLSKTTGIQAHHIWGWLQDSKTNMFYNQVIEEQSKTMSLMSNDSFLFWPVPSNRAVACAIGCYQGHIGTDIAVNVDASTPIYAAAAGTVVTIVNNQPYGANRSLSPGNGNFIKLQHNVNGTTYYTLYYHMANNIAVSLNSSIEAGTLLGFGANSGFTCGFEEADEGCLGYDGSFSHLHFQVYGSCGDSSCWKDPYVEELWLKDGQGQIIDPPPPGNHCQWSSDIGLIKIVTAGQTFSCGVTQQIHVLPESRFEEGSNVILYITN